MNVVQEYMSAWSNNQIDSFVRLLADNITATECDGATYRGVEDSRKWFAAWHSNSEVHNWQITDLHHAGEHVFAKWIFEYSEDNTPHEVDGLSDYLIKDGKIVELTEFDLAHKRYEPFADK